MPPCQAQEAKSSQIPNHSDLQVQLSFEAPPLGNIPGGWGGGPPGTVFADDKSVHGGRWSARIERHRGTPSVFSTITKSIPIDFSGTSRPGFRLLSKDVAYLKLSSVKEADCTHYVEEAAGTKGVIIDIRNYPSEFVVFALGSHLVESDTEFVRFTEGDLSNPGAFHWTKPLSLNPEKPHYSGRIVILADESSMSQAEYTSMAFRAAHGAIVIGSTTSGADGNVSPFALPGGLHTMISGLGVFYPDKSSTQRIGIVPSIEARPTIAGMRAGRDEVLEKAVRQILGRQVAAADIEKMARP